MSHASDGRPRPDEPLCANTCANWLQRSTTPAAAAIRPPFSRLCMPVISVLLLLTVAFSAVPGTGPATALHYAPNHNFGPRDAYLPQQTGFNIADVSSLGELHALPADVRALVWVGQCDGVTPRFLQTVRPFIGDPRVFGFYLMDNPDPRSRLAGGHLSAPCTASHLNAETDWIHANAQGTKTFIVLMNLSSSATPWFGAAYDLASLRVDLFGLDPYPCRSELQGCDYAMIDRYVIEAEKSGVPRSRIIPIYQAFGGGAWADDGGGTYLLPNSKQEQQILGRWGKLVPAPVFDYAYSWGRQKYDSALEDAGQLRSVFAIHNGLRVAEQRIP